MQRGGPERGLRAGGCQKFVGVRARDPFPAAGRSRRPVPAAPGPAPRSKGERGGEGRAKTQGSVGC